jgi:diguanylate cyclase (GGDEF)-like protein
VSDRLDDMSTFDRDDLKLFEALAGHASVALTNSGLVARVRAAAQETEHLSLHDPLTGLPNRLPFQQRLEKRLLNDGSAAVLLMDVDRFKEVNDTLGHDVGDRLLREVGRRLRQVERGETVVARLGGDEFAVLLGGDDVHIEGMVARITRDMSRPFDLGEVTLDVMASIGIAATPRDGSSAALLLRRAEVAMYDAKRGLTGVARYAADRDPYSSRRLSLIGDLARAVEESTLELHYQPQADPASGQVTGVEALLRWNHPLWGNVPPDEFIPLAEHTGLIKPLTRFVLETAVRQCVAWRDAGTPVLMAVNISMRNLLEPELADTVARMLVQAGLSAGLLKLEVTESAIVSDPERAVHALDRLVDLGLLVSVDDFGTGYSSLTRLRSLPVHEVKIDRSFVRHLAERADDRAIVRAVIGLGHDLGLRVVAEGVEDEASWRLLESFDCDLVQGYYLARPMPAEAMTAWLAEHFAAYATRLRSEATEPVAKPALGATGAGSPPDVRHIRRV